MTTENRYMMLTINGKELRVVHAGMLGYSRPRYYEISVGRWGVVWVHKDTNIYEYVCEGSYDWAMPQGWFDEYIKKHGERPDGVWYYPRVGNGNLFGRFLARKDAVLTFIEAVQKAHEETKKDG